MGAEHGHGRGRVAGLAVLAVGSLLLAGCASIPDSGDVEPVKASQQDDSQVRVYAVPPSSNASPSEIVDGFLEAMTSDDPNFDMARKYLTRGTARQWRPEDGTTVLREAPDRGQPAQPVTAGTTGVSYPLLGTEIATVDAAHVYHPMQPAKYRAPLHLVQEKSGGHKEWRIDGLPKGLVLGNSDFQRNYRSVDKYYFASDRDWLVADPVFIRQRIDPTTRMDPVTQAVNVLLQGPTQWLGPVVKTAFPRGTQLRKGTRSLEFDDRDALKVPLNARARTATAPQCKQMAAQLYFTVRDLTSTPVDQVELESGGSSLCTIDGDEAGAYAPSGTQSDSGAAYYLDASGRLARLKGRKDDVPVPGPFGDGAAKLGSVAVALDQGRAAGVTQDGRSLYVASIAGSADLRDPLVTSHGQSTADRLSAPSWDGTGDLWIADRDPQARRLLRIQNGAGTPQEVPVEGLDGRRIEGLRVSADGVRMALLLKQGSGTSLVIGRIEEHGSGAHATAAVVALKAVAPQMQTVTAVSWAGPSRLVIVGQQPGGVQQVLFIQADGSTTDASVLPGLNQVTAIAAGNDDNQPIVAVSDDAGIVRLPSGGNWQALVKDGSSPVYPG